MFDDVALAFTQGCMYHFVAAAKQEVWQLEWFGKLERLQPHEQRHFSIPAEHVVYEII
jgi:hypothetical protein